MLLYLGNVLSGLGYMTFVTFCMDSLSTVTAPEKLSTALGFGFACLAVIFLSHPKNITKYAK